MRSLGKCVVMALLLLPVGGCSGDNMSSLFQEIVATYNQLADEMTFVTDEESATQFSSEKLERIKTRWSDIRTKLEKFLKRADEEEKYKMYNLFVDQADEYLDVQMRLSKQAERLDQIRHKLFLRKWGHLPAHRRPVVDYKAEWPELTKVMETPETDFKLSEMLNENPFDLKSAQESGNDGGMPDGGMGPGGMGPGGFPGMGPGGP